MNRSQNEGLKRILDLCDELGSLRRRIRDARGKAVLSRRLTQATRRKIQALARQLKGYRFAGPIRALGQTRTFGTPHFLILATLLQAYLRGESPFLEGRILLKRAFLSTYEALRAASLLAADGALRRSGAVVPEEEPDADADVLELRFRLGEPWVMAFCAEAVGTPPTGHAPRVRRGYRNHREHLVDLRILHNLYVARRERVFGADWDRTTHAANRSRAHDRRIAAFAARIEQRLLRTPKAELFPAVQLQREFLLDQDSLVAVLHLLFSELFLGNSYCDVVELLKIVSGSEEELIQKRALFRPPSPLLRREVLVLEDMFENRILTAEARLAHGLTERLLGVDGSRQGIGSDEKLDFHLYLKDMDSAERFLEDLGESEGPTQK